MKLKEGELWQISPGSWRLTWPPEAAKKNTQTETGKASQLRNALGAGGASQYSQTTGKRDKCKLH